jgi:fibronectin type 3 domain-containing protein
MKFSAWKLLLTSLIILVITGCSVNNPPLKSSPNVPQVTTFRSLSDRDAIALEWNMVLKPNIAGYYIQRSDNDKKYKTVAKIENKYVAHWTDTKLKPNHTYFYKISTFTTQGIPSFAKLLKAKTLANIAPVPWIVNGGLKAKGMVKIVFRPHPNERVAGYYVQRFNDSNSKWENIATLKPRLRAEYIDKGLVDGKLYRYRIVAFTFDGLQSPPSKVVMAQTLQKPMAIINVSASTIFPKKIILTWQKIPSAIEYKIYYSDSKNGNFSLLATTKNTKYIDTINKNGFSRFYKVTSVNKYGLESMMPSVCVMGATLAIPSKPIVSIEQYAKSVKFILSSPDGRAVKYLIKKHTNNQTINIHNVHNGYIDNNDQQKHTYTYDIYAIDANGLVSKPSEVEVEF